MCPEFSVCFRYGDFLTNVSLCFALLLFMTPSMFKIMAWLLASVMTLAAIDHMRLLRYTTHTWHNNPGFSDAIAYLWGVPSGMLGSVGVFWIFSSLQLRYGGPTIAVAMVGFLVLHCLVYSAFITVFKQWHDVSPVQEAPYVDAWTKLSGAGKVYTYFNTNPVHVLRSWCMPSDEGLQNIIPYYRGKEHLQTGTHTFSKEIARNVSTEILKDVSLLGHAMRARIRSFHAGFAKELEDMLLHGDRDSVAHNEHRKEFKHIENRPGGKKADGSAKSALAKRKL